MHHTDRRKRSCLVRRRPTAKKGRDRDRREETNKGDHENHVEQSETLARGDPRAPASIENTPLHMCLSVFGATTVPQQMARCACVRKCPRTACRVNDMQRTEISNDAAALSRPPLFA